MRTTEAVRFKVDTDKVIGNVIGLQAMKITK